MCKPLSNFPAMVTLCHCAALAHTADSSIQGPQKKGIGFKDQVLTSAASFHPFLAPGCAVQASATNGKGQR